jgi:hypothetical protein
MSATLRNHFSETQQPLEGEPLQHQTGATLSTVEQGASYDAMQGTSDDSMADFARSGVLSGPGRQNEVSDVRSTNTLETTDDTRSITAYLYDPTMQLERTPYTLKEGIRAVGRRVLSVLGLRRQSNDAEMGQSMGQDVLLTENIADGVLSGQLSGGDSQVEQVHTVVDSQNDELKLAEAVYTARAALDARQEVFVQRHRPEVLENAKAGLGQMLNMAMFNKYPNPTVTSEVARSSGVRLGHEERAVILKALEYTAQYGNYELEALMALRDRFQAKRIDEATYLGDRQQLLKELAITKRVARETADFIASIETAPSNMSVAPTEVFAPSIVAPHVLNRDDNRRAPRIVPRRPAGDTSVSTGPAHRGPARSFQPGKILRRSHGKHRAT